MTNNLRTALSVRKSVEVTDGDGVRIKRSIGAGNQNRLDPFLLLDEIVSDEASDYIGGFPEHPHRGFETVTYLLEGRMRHRDHLGNEGLLESGGVQWMTAGSGVLHSEMPEQEQGRMHGFQLWVNLPAENKMIPANYQEFNKDLIPNYSFANNSSLKVIAGEINFEGEGIKGPVSGISTSPEYYDVSLVKGDELNLPLADTKNGLIYVYEGEVDIDGKSISAHHYSVLSEGGLLRVQSLENSGFLVIAGEAIKEPVAQWGPFVMNTMEEVDQAIQDYRNGKLV